jgi:uncharacterized membrane protein YwaF
MPKVLPRLLLILSALTLAAGGLMHARAFGKTLAAIAASDLEQFYANSLKALWLIDSATLLTLAALFAAIAARPRLGSGPVIVLLAIIPAATAFFLYKFIGNFVPAHMLVGSAVAAALAAPAWGSKRSNHVDA